MRVRYLETEDVNLLSKTTGVDSYPELTEVDTKIISALSKYYKTNPGEIEMVRETELTLNRFGYFGEDRPVRVIGKYKKEITMNDLKKWATLLCLDSKTNPQQYHNLIPIRLNNSLISLSLY